MGTKPARFDQVTTGRIAIFTGGRPVHLPDHRDGWRWKPYAVVEAAACDATSHGVLQAAGGHRRIRSSYGLSARAAEDDMWIRPLGRVARTAVEPPRGDRPPSSPRKLTPRYPTQNFSAPPLRSCSWSFGRGRGPKVRLFRSGALAMAE